MKNLLIWGRGGHSRIVEEAAKLMGYTTIETIDDTDGNKSWWRFFNTQAWDVHVAIGDNQSRERVGKDVKRHSYRLATITHPRSYVSPTAKISDGCYIGPMATVLTDVTLAEGCIVNTNASVDHDCFIDEYSHIAPGAHLCGTVHVGRRTLIAVGGVVVPKVTIGDDCVLGASSALVETIEGNGLKMWGIPARKVT